MIDSLESLKSYYRNPRAEVQPFFPEDIRTALEIGCGGGAYGEWMTSRGVEVTGIELEAMPARFAAQRLHRVLVGDALEQIRTLPEASFDLLCANDVLEHLPRPDLVLAEGRRVLKPGGRILISLPNIRYWDEFLRLAWQGEFPQEDLGIFDRTHLRWFTEKRIRRFVAECGFEIEVLQGVNPTRAKSFRLWRRLLGARIEDCRWLQYVVRARMV